MVEKDLDETKYHTSQSHGREEKSHQTIKGEEDRRNDLSSSGSKEPVSDSLLYDFTRGILRQHLADTEGNIEVEDDVSDIKCSICGCDDGLELSEFANAVEPLHPTWAAIVDRCKDVDEDCNAVKSVFIGEAR